MLTNALLNEIDQHVVITLYVKIYQEVMNVNVHPDFTVTHTHCAKNAIAWNANANHHINLLVEIAFWLVVQMVENVHLAPNVFQLLEELVTVHVRKDTVHKQMDHVSMLMNVLKVNTYAVMAPNVSINLVGMSVHVQ